MSKGIGPVSSHIYTLVKQEVMVERWGVPNQTNEPQGVKYEDDDVNILQ